MRRVKVAFGCVLVLGMFAVATSASLASEFRAFKGATEVKGLFKEKLNGSGEQKFSIGSGLAVVCTTLTGSGELSLPVSLLKFSFTYSGCKAKVSGVATAATVTSTGCAYVFSTTGTVNVECGTGSIVITAGSLCTIKVGTQSGLKKITYSPLETKVAAIKGVAEVAGITQTNNCSITGEVTYNGTAISEPTESGPTLEIK